MFLSLMRGPIMHFLTPHIHRRQVHYTNFSSMYLTSQTINGRLVLSMEDYYYHLGWHASQLIVVELSL
jgi:hypothetical protein